VEGTSLHGTRTENVQSSPANPKKADPCEHGRKIKTPSFSYKDCGGAGHGEMNNSPHRLVVGILSYDPPHQMTVGTPVNIDAAIRRYIDSSPPLVSGSSEARNLGLVGRGPIESENIPVAEEMMVTLRSEESGAFKIDPPDTDIKRDSRSLKVGQHAEWHWVVTPLVSGERHLILHSVFVKRMKDGSSIQNDQGSFERTIDIEVEPLGARIKDAVVTTFTEHWTMILAYFLPASGASLIAAWWTKRKKHSV
jgi:hypothetical protein